MPRARRPLGQNALPQAPYIAQQAVDNIVDPPVLVNEANNPVVPNPLEEQLAQQLEALRQIENNLGGVGQPNFPLAQAPAPYFAQNQWQVAEMPAPEPQVGWGNAQGNEPQGPEPPEGWAFVVGNNVLRQNNDINRFHLGRNRKEHYNIKLYYKHNKSSDIYTAWNRRYGVIVEANDIDALVEQGRQSLELKKDNPEYGIPDGLEIRVVLEETDMYGE